MNTTQALSRTDQPPLPAKSRSGTPAVSARAFHGTLRILDDDYNILPAGAIGAVLF